MAQNQAYNHKKTCVAHT